MKHQIGDTFQINYGKPPKNIRVQVVATIKGGDLIAKDKQGRFYTTWWEPNAAQKGKPPINKRHWRCYDQGLYYLRRGLLEAMVGTKQVKIPTIEQLRLFCGNTNAELAELRGKADLKKLEAIAKTFNQLVDFLDGKIRCPLKEARDQINFPVVYLDSLGRVNIGVLRAKLATIDRRFTTELEHLLGWLPHYAARTEAVANLQANLQRQVEQIARSLGAMISHEAFKTGKTSDKQLTGLLRALKRNIEIVAALSEIRPFNRWADMCWTDMQIAYQRLRTGNSTYALVDLNKVVNSCKLRRLGFTLEELILTLGIELAAGDEIHVRGLIDKINVIRDTLVKIDESGFAQPVMDVVGTKLSDCVKELNHPSGGRTPNLIYVKQLLKEAAALI